MKKILIGFCLATTLLSSNTVFAQGWRGPGVFLGGLVGGTVIGGAIASNYYRPYYPAYVVAPAYVQPQVVYVPSQPVAVVG